MPRARRRPSGRKALSGGKKIFNVNSIKYLTVPSEEATANYVPAAAVIRKWRALSGITGCKGCVGGLVSLVLNLPAQPGVSARNCWT